MKQSHRLFNVARVVMSDGDWTSGDDRHEDLSCGRVSTTVGICDPGELPEVPDSGDAWKVETFAVYVAQRFARMSQPDLYKPLVSAAVDQSSEYLAARTLWHGPDKILGTWEGELHLNSPDIETIDRQADPVDTLALLVDTAYERHPELAPILHLGTTARLRLREELDALDMDFVTSPAYPTNGMAVTGPIVIRLGSVDTTEQSIVSVNRFVVEGTRLATIAFSPCRSLRVVEVTP